MGPRETKQTPPVKSPASSVATSTPRRVLPTPPIPTSVKRRTSGRLNNVQAATTSCSRPTNGASRAGSWPLEERAVTGDDKVEAGNREKLFLPSQLSRDTIGTVLSRSSRRACVPLL